ncbi:hypothetical protein QFZ97_002115 [Paraburkholderia youngii]
MKRAEPTSAIALQARGVQRNIAGASAKRLQASP